MRRKILLYVALGICGLVLLNIMYFSIYKFHLLGMKKIQRLFAWEFYSSISVIWAVLFGFLIEWRGVWKIIKGQIQIRWHLALAVVFLIINLIPLSIWHLWLGVGMMSIPPPLGYLVNFMGSLEINMILGVLAGILLVRSLDKSHTIDKNEK